MTNTNKKAIITIGISSSGKTSWINNFTSNNSDNDSRSYYVINRDEIRHKYLCDVLNLNIYAKELWQHWRPMYESNVTEMIKDLIADLAKSDNNIIISGTNLNPSFRQILIDTLLMYGYDIYLKLFDVELKDALYTNYIEGKGISDNIIKKQFDAYNRSKYDLSKLSNIEIRGSSFKLYDINKFEMIYS